MSAELSVTLIDVGWGDSILLESRDKSGKVFYALIDSNDTTYLRSSYIYLKRFFERKGINPSEQKHVFEFAILSHAHADHGQGLKAIFREYGTKNFWYSKSESSGILADLIRYSDRYDAVEHHQAIDDTKILPDFGDVSMRVLWPPYNRIDEKNENNNSIVLLMSLNGVSFVLSGDAEKDVWNEIANMIPDDTRFFKVPHHGSVNGTFDGDETPWFDKCPHDALLGISSHIQPHTHPDEEVIELFDSNKRKYYRTDLHYHITVTTDGSGVQVKYSH